MPTLNWIGKEKIVNYDMDVDYHVLNKSFHEGEDRKNEDSQLKVKLGKKWADLSGNKFSYFMVFLKEAFKEDEAYNLADTLDIIRNL